MLGHEVVDRKMQAERCAVVLPFLAERIGEPGHAPVLTAGMSAFFAVCAISEKMPE